MNRSNEPSRGGTGGDGNVGGGKSGLQATDTRVHKRALPTPGGDGDQGNVGDEKSGLEGEDTRPNQTTFGGTGDQGNVGGEKSGLEAVRIGLAPGEGPVRLTIRQEVVLEIARTEGRAGDDDEGDGRTLGGNLSAEKSGDQSRIGGTLADTQGGGQ